MASASRFTAFVAVQTQVRVEGTPVEIVQPVELPQGWSADFLASPANFSLPTAPRSSMSVRPQLREAAFLLNPHRLERRETTARRSPGKRWADKDGDGLEALLLGQRADGSWGGDVRRTAAALACLVLAGHTRRTGSHRQAVRKAYDFLVPHARLGVVQAVLQLADQPEGAEFPPRAIQALETLTRSKPEGRLLKKLLDRLAAPQRSGSF